MSLAANRERSQKNAKDLLARGYFHGKRQSKPSPALPNPLSPKFIFEHGSAAYRRDMAAKKSSR